jgi:DTW domain-containing protein YfiP
MRAIKKARKLIEQNPELTSSKILSRLVLALESESEFRLNELYDLTLADFELALEVLHDWRLDRYYEGKAKLFDISLQVKEMDPT